MTSEEKAVLKEKIIEYLRRLTYTELNELKINGQITVKLLQNKPVAMRDKTMERLRYLVEKKSA